MNSIRPAGSGREASAVPIIRQIANPRAGLVIVSNVDSPSDWPANEGQLESNLGHALGWTCEVRRDNLVILNPLGEGHVKAPVPHLTAEWLTHVRQDGSCALYLAPTSSDAEFGELTISAAASTGDLTAATIRTAIADDYGQVKPVGRNKPCTCGSGKKFKHCHG